MAPRSWGYLPYWEGESHGVGSLCVVRKVFPYTNVHGDLARPHGIRWCAHPSVDVIRLLSMKMYQSA